MNEQESRMLTQEEIKTENLFYDSTGDIYICAEYLLGGQENLFWDIWGKERSHTHTHTNTHKLKKITNSIKLLVLISYRHVKKKLCRGFPGGAVVENLPANAGDTGSCPGLGRSHMPRSN